MVNIYIKTFLITIIVFIIGISLGITIEDVVVSRSESDASGLEDFIQGIELETLYLQDLSDERFCESFNNVVLRTNEELDKLAILLVNEKDTIFRQDDVENIKKRYTYTLIKDWLLQKKIKNRCNSDTVLILYFYSIDNCEDCIIQGNILTSLKNEFKDKLLVFPFDSNVNLDMLDVLERDYNITTYPTIVINENKYDGLIPKDSIRDEICGILDNGC